MTPIIINSFIPWRVEGAAERRDVYVGASQTWQERPI